LPPTVEPDLDGPGAFPPPELGPTPDLEAPVDIFPDCEPPFDPLDVGPLREAVAPEDRVVPGPLDGDLLAPTAIDPLDVVRDAVAPEERVVEDDGLLVPTEPPV
jgi:hypothetical protein